LGINLPPTTATSVRAEAGSPGWKRAMNPAEAPSASVMLITSSSKNAVPVLIETPAAIFSTAA